MSRLIEFSSSLTVLLQYGNRFGVCAPGVFASDSGYGGFLCLARSGEDGIRRGDFQVLWLRFNSLSSPSIPDTFPQA